jgi:ABC-type transport system involved in multi-copper enzyme maturation permease subunit
LLVTVAILTVLMAAFTTWGFSRLNTLQCGDQPCAPTEIRLATAFLLIVVAYMYNVVLAMGSVFVAAPAVAGELESGLALAILPRPIRRGEILLGKWLGLGLLVAFYALATGVIEFLGVKLVVDYLPPHPFEALLYLAGESLILLTLALLLSTRLSPMTSGVIAVVVFGMAWLAGFAEQIGLAFNNLTLINVGVVMSLLLPTDGLWRGAVYSMEPVAVLALGNSSRGAAAGNPFFVSAPPTMPYLLWAAIWIVAILGIAVFSFERRDV